MSKKETETRTPVSKLGKYNLTERLAARFTVVNDSTLQGYGDDAAVAFFMDPLSVSAQQLALEGVDFDLSYVPLKFIGYKTAIGAMGQVMAMNAVPVQLLVNIGVSQRFFVEDIDDLLIRFLSPREIKTVRAYFMEKQILRDIGISQDVTTERVRQIISRALNKIRRDPNFQKEFSHLREINPYLELLKSLQ